MMNESQKTKPAPTGQEAATLTGVTPDLVPARMLNEYAYCPRLAYLEWVQGEFADSVDTIEGRFQHRRVDRPSGELPSRTANEADAPEEEDAAPETIHARSVLLSDTTLGAIARIDLIERPGQRGHPGGLQAWPGPRRAGGGLGAGTGPGMCPGTAAPRQRLHL